MLVRDGGDEQFEDMEHNWANSWLLLESESNLTFLNYQLIIKKKRH